MKLNIGCHLSVSGGYEKMGKAALSIGASTFQFFTRNPRGGSFKRPTDSDIEALNSILEENEFAPIVAHAPYTLNPCGVDESLRDYTKSVMAEDVKLLENVRGAYYNFHPGCHVSQGVEIGIEKTADTVNHISQFAKNTVILIETMSGKGSEIGKTFEEIREIIDRCNNKEVVGVCLDTCHAHDGRTQSGQPDGDLVPLLVYYHRGGRDQTLRPTTVILSSRHPPREGHWPRIPLSAPRDKEGLPFPHSPPLPSLPLLLFPPSQP